MEELSQKQIEQAIELVRKHPKNIGVNLLKLYMIVGTITANRLLEELENRKIISKCDKGRKLLV